jgi:hypothetical protein
MLLLIAQVLSCKIRMVLSSYARYSPDPRSTLSNNNPTPTWKRQPPSKFPTTQLISARCGDPPRPIGHFVAGIPNRACLGEMTMHRGTGPRRVRSLSLSLGVARASVCSGRCGKKPRSLASAVLVPETGQNGRTITAFRHRGGSAWQIFCSQMSVWKAGDWKDWAFREHCRCLPISRWRHSWQHDGS